MKRLEKMASEYEKSLADIYSCDALVEAYEAGAREMRALCVKLVRECKVSEAGCVFPERAEAHNELLEDTAQALETLGEDEAT